MNSAERALVKELYWQGRDLDGEARQKLLDQACGDCPEVRAELASLWQNGHSGFHFDTLRTLTARIFHHENEPDATKTTNEYTLLETIGQGGMGMVFKAQQEGPIKRLVALKILGPELATEEHFQRFRAEQKALAMMKHPNIAMVFDAGMSDGGRPFYTMEFLDPLSLTTYCDQHRLTVGKRVRLMIQICEAVQHAHQKGVIHRDIKPSNILIASGGNRVEPKVIDFGLARLLDKARLEELAVTRTGMVMGTPAYMSPEQAGSQPEAVDTRSDIYALGVLLYELLTGVTPLGAHLEKAGSQNDLRRIIEEVDPLPPDVRLNGDIPNVAMVAAQRGRSLRALGREITGDLGWITMKALDKDPNRRYSTCSEMAADLRWHLEDLPVSAGPPGRVYHLRKLARRYKRALVTAAVIMVALSVGFTAAAIGLVQANRAKSQALASAQKMQAVNDFYLDMLSAVDPAFAGSDVKMIQLLEIASRNIERDLAAHEEIKAEVYAAMGNVYRGLGNYQDAENHLQKALALQREHLGDKHRDSLATTWNLARVHVRSGAFSQAENLLIETILAQEETLGPKHPDTMNSKNTMAFLRYKQGAYDQAEWLYREILGTTPLTMGQRDPQVLAAMGGLADVLVQQGRLEESGQIYAVALEGLRTVLGEGKPQTAATRNNYTNLLIRQGRYAEAEQLHRQNLTLRIRVLGEAHPRTLSTQHNLAWALYKQKQFKQAEHILREVYRGRQLQPGAGHPDTLTTVNLLAATLGQQGRVAEAIVLLEKVLSRQYREIETTHPALLRIKSNLANYLITTGDLARSEALLQETLEQKRTIMGRKHPSTMATLCTLAENLQKQGRLKEAAGLFQKVVRVMEETHPNHPGLPVYRGLYRKCLDQMEP